MTEFLPLFLFVVLTILLMLGYPVAFTLGGVPLGMGLIGFGWNLFELIPLRIWGVMSNFTLIAVPLFIFMGVTLQRSGLAEELLETMGLAFGRMRGGLAISVIIVGALLAASTGIVGATVVTMGLIALPTMLRWGYSPEVATGTIAASGTLGQIIPPSIVLVLLGDVLGISVGDLFIGALLPGFILVGLYILWILFVSIVWPEQAPSVSAKERAAISNRELWLRVCRSMIPPLFLILVVLGSIFFGIASPTEAAAVGGAGSLLLSVVNRRLNLRMLREVMWATTRLTSMVFTILVVATIFGLTFRGLGGDAQVRALIEGLPFGAWGIFAIVMGLIFILGFFLDFTEITFIHVPILAPIMQDLGIDPLWFGVCLAIILQTSFLTPPFGFSLFYLKGVAPPGISTGQIYRGIIPYVALQLVGFLVVVFFPAIATWLPRVIFG